MNAKWQQLAVREKQLILVGGVVVIAAILYGLIWAPLMNHVDSLRNELHDNQQLLSFMKAADKKIRLFSDTNITTHESPVSLLSGVQQQLNQAPLNHYPVLLKQVDSDSVELTFKQVHFDQLITWLIHLSETQHWVVKQMTLKQGASVGMVSTTFILTSV